jgi:hypothetical protein
VMRLRRVGGPRGRAAGKGENEGLRLGREIRFKSLDFNHLDERAASAAPYI